MAGAPKNNSNALRPGQDDLSAVRLAFLCTEEEKASYRALARYLRMTFSELVRSSLDARRQALIADGKRPPKR